MIEDLVSAGLVAEGVPLGPMTTYKLGGPAAYFVEVDDEESLSEVTESGVTATMPVLILGRGSNLVVADNGFPGLVIRLGKVFSDIDVDVDSMIATAGAAVPLPRLARTVVDKGLTGLEFFVGVPGSVGGAVRQNAGCFGRETADCLIEAVLVNLATGERRQASPVDLDLSYRQSNVRAEEVVLKASFRLEEGDAGEARTEMRSITRWRKENQPGGTLNAGSVFKNPSEIPAGALIDSLGLKGTRVGDVQVSERHANFFVAGPDATADDFAKLVQVVKDRVFEMSGTILEPEIQMVGFDE